MQSVLRCMLFAVVTLAGAECAADGMAGVAAEEARAMRAVIEAQLEAFAADDAVRAFSYASPSIRALFGDAASFMAMVHQGYEMLIRPTEAMFLRPVEVEQEVMQAVHLRDQDGRAWLAIYDMQRQPDQSWRINGCIVKPGDDDSST